ncbi:MAG: hypothetical protein RBR15_11815 [Sphaerochaeta sp.]|nr:hypothetical protein [Sphaerochaeta sp.]
MEKLIRDNTIQLGSSRMEERSSQWDGFPLFFVLLEEISVEVARGYCEY